MRRTVLITGSSRNLGFYLAEKFSVSNEVIAISRSVKKNNFAFNYKCDLSSYKSTKKLLLMVKKKFKKIDLIICCAGNSKFVKNKDFLSSEDWINSFKSNFLTTSNVIDSYLKIFNIKTKIVVISSIAGNTIMEAPISYSVCKAALNFYCQYKAKLLATKKIKLNIISPGNIFQKNNTWDKKSRMNPGKVKNYIKKTVPLNVFVNPEQIYEMCEYLFSKNGDFITGSNFTIDAGQSVNKI
jgi:NAD(P)-dependent dehydrogenase (short-subunit alcohol dehydrogenase family)